MARTQKFLFAIGDIHGCDAALEALLTPLLSQPWPCVFLGDYLDRGPSSSRVVEMLIQAKSERADWKFLMGNHEQMFLEDLDSSLEQLPFDPGQAKTEYTKLGGLPHAHREFLEELDTWWESDQFLFMHGGIAGDVHLPVDLHDTEELLWTYNISKEWRGKTIVRGHRAVKFPKQHRTHIDLDTGCCFGGYLTAGLLDDLTGHFVGSIQVAYDGELLRFGDAVREAMAGAV